MAGTIMEQLLHASLLCGMKPGGEPAHRLLVFFVANKDLGSSSHEGDFQRALETGADQKGFWRNANKWSGEYLITEKGYKRAVYLFPSATPRYRPLHAHQFFREMEGYIESVHVRIKLRHRAPRVFLDGQECSSAKKACQIVAARTGLSINTQGESAVRVLYNLGIDNHFAMRLGLPS